MASKIYVLLMREPKDTSRRFLNMHICRYFINCMTCIRYLWQKKCKLCTFDTLRQFNPIKKFFLKYLTEKSINKV